MAGRPYLGLHYTAAAKRHGAERQSFALPRAAALIASACACPKARARLRAALDHLDAAQARAQPATSGAAGMGDERSVAVRAGAALVVAAAVLLLARWRPPKP